MQRQNEIWESFDRMQKIAMAKESIITKSQFFDQPENEQRDYYN